MYIGISLDGYTIGERIKIERTKQRIRRATLAKTLNIPYSTLATYENDHRGIPDDIKVKLSVALDVSIDYLLGTTNNPQGTLPQEEGLKYLYEKKNILFAGLNKSQLNYLENSTDSLKDQIYKLEELTNSASILKPYIISWNLTVSDAIDIFETEKEWEEEFKKEEPKLRKELESEQAKHLYKERSSQRRTEAGITRDIMPSMSEEQIRESEEQELKLEIEAKKEELFKANPKMTAKELEKEIETFKLQKQLSSLKSELTNLRKEREEQNDI